MPKQIQIAKGKFAIVDDEDYESLIKHKWSLSIGTNRTYYAHRRKKSKEIINGESHMISMHCSILKAPYGFQIDHINGNGLDNRKCNLRIASRSENQRNSQKRIDNTSGYKGVYLDKGARHKRWKAQICVNSKRINLGRYHFPEQAAQAYDDAARKYFGDFARTNF